MTRPTTLQYMDGLTDVVEDLIGAKKPDGSLDPNGAVYANALIKAIARDELGYTDLDPTGDAANNNATLLTKMDSVIREDGDKAAKISEAIRVQLEAKKTSILAYTPGAKATLNGLGIETPPPVAPVHVSPSFAKGARNLERNAEKLIPGSSAVVKDTWNLIAGGTVDLAKAGVAKGGLWAVGTVVASVVAGFLSIKGALENKGMLAMIAVGVIGAASIGAAAVDGPAGPRTV